MAKETETPNPEEIQEKPETKGEPKNPKKVVEDAQSVELKERLSRIEDNQTKLSGILEKLIPKEDETKPTDKTPAKSNWLKEAVAELNETWGLD